jgi:hypothetical protein
MMNLAAAKPSMKRNLGKRYFVQTEPWQREPVVKLRLSQLRAPGSRYSTTEVIEDELYVWTFEGSVLWRHILLGGLIGCFLLACLFPVWPDIMKLGVWYLSVTLLLVLFVLGSTPCAVECTASGWRPSFEPCDKNRTLDRPWRLSLSILRGNLDAMSCFARARLVGTKTLRRCPLRLRRGI